MCTASFVEDKEVKDLSEIMQRHLLHITPHSPHNFSFSHVAEAQYSICRRKLFFRLHLHPSSSLRSFSVRLQITVQHQPKPNKQIKSSLLPSPPTVSRGIMAPKKKRRQTMLSYGGNKKERWELTFRWASVDGVLHHDTSLNAILLLLRPSTPFPLHHLMPCFFSLTGFFFWAFICSNVWHDERAHSATDSMDHQFRLAFRCSLIFLVACWMFSYNNLCIASPGLAWANREIIGR